MSTAPPTRSRKRRRPRRGVLLTWAAIVAASLLVAAMVPVWPVLRLQSEGEVLTDLRLHEDRLVISYVHSIDKLPIEEYLQVRDGRLVVESTRIRQFGAGMGHRQGEGSGHADGQWWVLTDLDRDIGTDLHLRVGPESIDHRVRTGDRELALSSCVPRQRVTMTPDSISTLQLLWGAKAPACEGPPATAAESERP